MWREVLAIVCACLLFNFTKFKYLIDEALKANFIGHLNINCQFDELNSLKLLNCNYKLNMTF